MKTGRPILPIHIENVPPILGKKQKWYDIGTKTSVYTLKLKKKIIYTMVDDQTIRDAAICITNLASNAMF